jgi:hypothetical protein
VTLYGSGGRLLLDPGFFSYDGGPRDGTWREFFRSAAAHNVVAVDGPRMNPRASRLTRSRLNDTRYEAVVKARPANYVVWTRRLLFSRQEGYLVIEDRLQADRSTRFRQLWHLREHSAPVVAGQRTWTRSPSGDVLIQQLGRAGRTRLIEGQSVLRQGWVSYQYRKALAAPVVEHAVRGRTARFVTLVVPFAGHRPPVRATELMIGPEGFSLVVSISGRQERVLATARGSTIRALARSTPGQLPRRPCTTSRD